MLKQNRLIDAVRFTQREREYVFGVAMRYMKNEDEAAEVAQEALMLAFRHRKSFQGKSRYTTWLYRIAATTALMRLRKHRRRPTSISFETLPAAEMTVAEPVSSGRDPESRTADRQVLHRVERALSEMDSKYSSIFTMRFVEGLSEAEIARELRLNVSTVKTRAYRARAQLRERLSDCLDGATDALAA